MQVFPPPAGYPSIVTMPLLNFAVIAGGAMLLVHILTWTGRSMGGAGTVESVLTILVWLQAIWLVFDIISFVLILAAPGLALIFVMATAFFSFWIFLNFLSAAHQFDTLWRAFTVLFVSIVGLILGLAVLAALAGVDASGVPANV
jgi:hypothetical protein